MFDFLLSGPWGVALVVVLVLIVISLCVVSMWRKVPQDKALVVTGMRKRVISGGGGLVVPLLERGDMISLENMQIVVNVKGLTSTGVEIGVSALTIIKVKNEHEKILAAMEQFNTGNTATTITNIVETSREVLEGKLREILSGMTVEEIYQNREKFATSVQDVATRELEDMGIEIKAFTIKEIKDEQGYLSSLGKRQVAVVKKDADIAESNAWKERELILAQNARETAIKKAEYAKDTEIQLATTKQQVQEAQAQADIKIADARKEKELRVLSNTEATQRQQAVADIAYEVEQNKRRKEIIESDMSAQVLQEQKNIELTKAQMDVQMTREEQETMVAKQRALRTQEELQSQVQKKAEAEAAKVKTMADADLYKRTKDAEAKKLEEIAQSEAEAKRKELQAAADAIAKQKEAEANAFAKQKEAEANAFAIEKAALANASAVRQAALSEAESIEAKGKANAEAIELVGLADAKAAEAKGLADAKIVRETALAEAEGKKQLAEAYMLYGEAAMTQMIVEALPDITKNMSEAVSSAMAQVGSMTIIDNGGGAGKATDYAVKLLTEIPELVKATTGINLKALLSNRLTGNVNVSADESSTVDASASSETLVGKLLDAGGFSSSDVMSLAKKLSAAVDSVSAE